MKRIEFDPAKDRTNRKKHRLSLAEAGKLNWMTVVIAPDVRFDYGEPRFRAYGMLNGRLHMAVFTPRGGRLRIISFRPANRTETRRYGQADQT